ncbi:D-alanyl-D-alanine carboxypeptidase [Streptomyces sp. NPDC059567]|uniref:D-alanyl-D-alanine carboxypeptidase family protein n=1 Tax=Streptomyces sp. NPDC059567 TaxID=3346867 RepID=UPI0036BFEB4C
MTHGGGTVAGESPDKAEQQESSQEAPAGGGGRDPRLAVLRESASSSTASTGSTAGASTASPVQVDQPTAVFKTPAPRTSEDAAPSEDAVSEDAAPQEPAEGDRLRAAVAAWVASGDGEDEADGEPAGEAADEATDEATDADGEDEAEGDAAAAETDVVVEADAGAETDAADEVDADAEPVDGDEPAADADVETDTDSDRDAEKAQDSWFAARKPADAEPEAEAESEAEPEADEPAPEAQPEADAESAPEGEPEAAPEAAEEPKADEPVDQPTTMFRAVRPPVVDQPTTALKLPPLPEPPATPKPAAERPSTFVPLRAEAATAKAPETKAPETKAPPAKAPEAKAPVSPPPPSLTEAERTRQQPMPPLPPLDLLAELTNTPPPPQTPLRTTMRRVRIWTPLVILLLIIFAVVQFVRPLPNPALTLSASPTFTFEGGELNMPWPTEGQGAAEVEGVGSLGTYGAQKPAPLASVAKTMTAYVILRDHPIKGKETGPEIEIDKKAADEAGAEFESTAAVKEGQTYTEKELLQLLMIPSANNVARRLARWDAGSEAAFVEKMNAAAKDLGMTDSVYTDPSGLESTTVSTPQDQLKLAKAVMQYDVFREIVNMPNLTVDGIPGQIENNNNIVLEPGVSGIKTGSSTPAGGNLLWAANTVIDGKQRRILGIVMGAKDAPLLHEKLQLSIDYSLKLIQAAQKDVTSAAVVRKGQVVGHIDDGLGGITPVVADKELKAVGWPGLKVNLELTAGGKTVPHTGKAGDVVGQVSIGTGTGKVSAPVSLQKDLVEPGFDRKLTRLG